MSLVLFGGLIVVSMLVGVIGLFIRWKSFCPGENDVMESFASRDAAYYFNNVIMIVFTVILCYLTVASALLRGCRSAARACLLARTTPSRARLAWCTARSLLCARCFLG